MDLPYEEECVDYDTNQRYKSCMTKECIDCQCSTCENIRYEIYTTSPYIKSRCLAGKLMCGPRHNDLDVCEYGGGVDSCECYFPRII